MSKPLVAIIMGSDSDLSVMQDAAKVLESFGVSFEIDVISAHRTPKRAFEFASTAHTKGIKVIIAAAGLAAHLAGAIAGNTPLPVIGVPIAGGKLQGVDSMLSTLQMPPGVPVATVAINGAKNAGLLAVQILSVADDKLLDAFLKYKAEEERKVIEKSRKLQELGYKAFLDQQK